MSTLHLLEPNVQRMQRGNALKVQAEAAESVFVEWKFKYEGNKGQCFTSLVLVMLLSTADIFISSIPVLESSVSFSLDLAQSISHLMKYYFTFNRIVLIKKKKKKKKLKVASIGQDVEKPEPFVLLA